MTPLSAITGLTAETAELLTTAGVRSAAHLANEDPSGLHSRLEVLAWQRGRNNLTPPRDQVEHWVAVARVLTPPVEAEAAKLSEIPEAIPIASPPGAWMPPALRAAAEAAGMANPETEIHSVREQSAAAPDKTWRKVNSNNFLTIEAYNEGRIAVQPLSRESLKDSPTPAAEAAEPPVDEEDLPSRVQRIRGGEGDEVSRWVRRGVVHPRPVHTWLGAVVSLLWRMAALAGVVAFLWLITSSRQPSAHTDKVIACFAVLFVLGCMQLHFAAHSRCRICSCNLYYSKNCHKNRKAHLIPGLGYVASAALHLLIFGWFRCMYCGTAIRLHPNKRHEGEG